MTAPDVTACPKCQRSIRGKDAPCPNCGTRLAWLDLSITTTDQDGNTTNSDGGGMIPADRVPRTE